MKKVIVMCLAAGLMARAANAATLSMRWAGTTDTTIALIPSDYATIEIVWTWGALDKAKTLGLTDIEGRINVWNHEPISPETAAQAQVPAGAAVTNVTANFGGTTAISDPLGSDLGWYFFAMNNMTRQVGNGTVFSIVLGTITIHGAGYTWTPVYISFSAIEPHPGPADGPNLWLKAWQTAVSGPGQFVIGQGNPGDRSADWDPYHGYETFQPLTLLVDGAPAEPGTLLLLALGGLAMLRRR